jgi:hypothetical protein
MTYRGYTITKERFGSDTIIWVETPEGASDVGSVREAKQTIDRIIEEKALLAAPQ